MRIVLILMWCVLAAWGTASARAQEQAEAPPAQARELLRLLEDPGVRRWIQQTAKAGPAAAPTDMATPEPALSSRLAARLTSMRDHIGSTAAAVPRLPAQLARAGGLLNSELAATGIARLALLLSSFLILGFGSERVYRALSSRYRASLAQRPVLSVEDRFRTAGLRLVTLIAGLAIFAAGSLGAFLLFAWPPLLKQIMLAFLVAMLITRGTLALLDFAMFPPRGTQGGWSDHQIVPVKPSHAIYWRRRIVLFVGYFAFGWSIVGILVDLGFPNEFRFAAAYLLGLGLLAIGLEAIWSRPRGDDPVQGFARMGKSLALTAYAVALWGLWAAGLLGMFWIAVFATLLPKAIALGKAAVGHLLRPVEGQAVAPIRHNILEVCLERGVRLVILIAATFWLAHIWQVDLVEMTSQDGLLMRLLRGALASIVILLLADFFWEIIKAAVDGALADPTESIAPGSNEAIRRARLRTLLPIFRNILFVAIAVMAGLTALAALGFEIGPLIAGAGVLGVAIGFGAQSLVRDIISGMFYLLDDAFRVGEYIQSGSFKGTVESFSLRSVRLRHHRGPVYTVPFGQLGAVQNMSRDWVIDKFMINVTYDSDLEKARKVAKKIGQELAEDPELAPDIIEPMKMQGVEQFGDYAIQLRFKMTTRPGQQAVVRRKALLRLKTAFDQAGIKFAHPTVHVEGRDEEAAAAQQMMTAAKVEAAKIEAASAAGR
ncbi:mechanosensitive ion channel family protein [Bosea sp. BIWAKO-01]|uniref:mechanosensitive ion channel family protein n=1 Tax=Bosea sp. BIWAKO-01 TaxID=506668 RepID=UPI00085294CA|nr:mechanosensitive ion channel family protein [Bosea sp. BIWAKO-01]GAU86148.1 potassium efflux system KefA protein [Bosea sp. BIWAKO-01]